jgi:Uma2 family endonuclease
MTKLIKSKSDLCTVSDFYRLVEDGQKADLLDGVIYMASPDSIRSNDLTGFVLVLMRMFNEARRIGGRVFVTRVAFRLTRRRAPEPDVAFVGPKRLHIIGKVDVKGPPDIVVEIVSRDSKGRDYGIKKRTYRKAGAGEYWIIDPLAGKVEFYRLRDGAYHLVPLEHGCYFHSEELPGFWLDVRWLLSDPLPNAYDCLQLILQGPPSPPLPRAGD